VKEYYAERTGEDIYPSDVAVELDLDPLIVHEVTEELVREGALT